MSKRGHNEGSVYEDRSRGGWVAAVSCGYDETGKIRKLKRRARTKTEAKGKLRELQREREDGLPIGNARRTIDDLLTFYVETVMASRDLSPNTLKRDMWVIETYLRPSLGRRRARDLAPQEVENLLRRARDEHHLSRDSLVRIRSVLVRALREAQRREWVHRNAAELAHVPKSHRTERRSMNAEQARALLAVAKGSRMEAPIMIGLSRGLRPGEILGLRWADIDLECQPPILSVQSTLRNRNGVLSLGEPKTSKSCRRLELPKPAAMSLRIHRKLQATERLSNADVWADNDLVFCTEIGTLWDPSNFRREFQKLTKAAGLGRWTPYEMRHSAISLLSAAGEPLENLADLAGHTNLRMVTETYRHQLGGVVSGGAERIDGILAPAAQASG